jgi:hypothetical protein
LSVKYFNELLGVDPSLLKLLNERIKAVQESCVEQLDLRDKKIEHLSYRLSIFEKMKPDQFRVADMKIDHLFEAVALVHKRPYQVFNALVEAFPKDHFKQCMKDHVFQDDERFIELRSIINKKLDAITH